MHTPNIYPHMHAHHTLVHKHIHMYICTTLPTYNTLTHIHMHVSMHIATHTLHMHACHTHSYICTCIHIQLIFNMCAYTTLPAHILHMRYAQAAHIHMHVYAHPSQTPHRYISMYYSHTLHIRHMYTHAYSITVAYPISYFLFSL